MYIYLNNCNFKSHSAIFGYINGMYKQDMKKDIWERHVAMTLYAIKQGMGKDTKYKSYDELLSMLDKKQDTDKRTPQEIYQDTMNLFKRGQRKLFPFNKLRG